MRQLTGFQLAVFLRLTQINREALREMLLAKKPMGVTALRGKGGKPLMFEMEKMGLIERSPRQMEKSRGGRPVRGYQLTGLGTDVATYLDEIGRDDPQP